MLTYASPDGRWSLMGYVRNLEDKAVKTNSNSNATTGVSTSGTAFYAPPRLYGLRLSARVQLTGRALVLPDRRPTAFSRFEAYMSKRWLIGAAALALVAPAWAGEVGGKVTGPNGAPVAGARVVINDLLRGDTTEGDGVFDLPRLPGGEYEVSVTAMGLASQSRRVSVPQDGAVKLDVQLAPNTALPQGRGDERRAGGRAPGPEAGLSGRH
ncbi:carboxypeptidase regulatory-like domain-containing protein [Caulobacter segnis]